MRHDSISHRISDSADLANAATVCRRKKRRRKTTGLFASHMKLAWSSGKLPKVEAQAVSTAVWGDKEQCTPG